MAVKTEKFLAAFYNDQLREKLRLKIDIVSGGMRKINLTFSARGDGAYTALDGKSKDKLRIYIGGQLIKKIAGLPDTLTSRKAVKALIKGVVLGFYGALNHELGHDLYTDMWDRSIIDYPEAKYRGFMHQMFNIIEDQVIEFYMEMLYKKEFPRDINPRVYFNFMIKNIFEVQAEEYKDDGTQMGFMNYLLLFFRVGEAKIKNRCKVFDKYRTDLIPLFRKVLGETNATERIHKTIELCEWIIKNISEFDWKMEEPDETEKISGKLADGPAGGSAPREGIPGGESSLGGGDRPEEMGPSGEDEKDKEEGKDGEEKKEEEEEKSSPEEAAVDDTIDEDILDDIFNDVIRDGSDHEWVIAKDEYEVIDDDLVNQIDEDIKKSQEPAQEISKVLTLFKGRRKPRVVQGLSRGKLSIKKLIQNDLKDSLSFNFFKKEIARGKNIDLCACLVTDNSGSMSGEKSRLCSIGCLAFAQACDWAKIPFEVHAFTKTHDSWDGISITITEKSLEDTFEASKPYFAINDRGKISGLKASKYIPTFCGNSEEVNIFYIGEKFARVKHQSKLMIVLCDGQTTGSAADLRKVVTRLESEYGIIVIGIGILNDDVVHIYNHAKVFANMEELETGLAPYLVETLSKYALN